MNMEKTTKEPKTNLEILGGYFQGHQCHLSASNTNFYDADFGPLRKFLLDISTVQKDDIRARYIFRSHAALCAEKYRQYKHYPLSIHPYSKLRFWLEATFAIFMFLSNSILALQYSKPNPAEKGVCAIIMYTLDFTIILNVIVNCFTGYVEGNTCQYVTLDLKKILFKYARTCLIIDLIACACNMPKFYHDDVIIETILMSSKILRIPIFFSYVQNTLTVLRAGIVTNTVIVSTLVLISYLTWNIYFQYAVEYMFEGTYMPENPRKCSWISIVRLWNATWDTRFTYSLDRAVSMLRENANLNLLKEDGCFEVFFSVSWIISKLLVFHCSLKYMIALLGTESARAKFFMMSKQVQSYMNQRKFPPRIKKKILKFYAIRFQSHFFVVLVTMESRMMSCVSGQLREDIFMYTGRQLVRDVEFLKQLPRSLLLQIGIKLKIVIYISGDIIYKINTVGDSLYFIDKGTVSIYSKCGQEICHLEDGDFFGEVALIMKNRFRTTTAVAVTNCELFKLDREDFDSSIACYPMVYEEIKKVAYRRKEISCVIDEHYMGEMKMRKEKGK